MTVHIAFAENGNAVVLSDSQGSTLESELHGIHKQFAGGNYVVGVAGHGGIGEHLRYHLGQSLGAAPKDSQQIQTEIQGYFDGEVREPVRAKSQVLVAAHSSTTDVEIRVFTPGVFNKFSPPQRSAMIGSGAEFAGRTREHDRTLGISIPTQSLSDKIIAAVYYANAADESLTVDDKLFCTLLTNGRAYMLGDASVPPDYADPRVQSNWPLISTDWQEMVNYANAISHEIVQANRTFSHIRYDAFEQMHLNALREASEEVAKQHAGLTQKVDDFLRCYDRRLGR